MLSPAWEFRLFRKSANENEKHSKPKKISPLFSCSLKTFVTADFCSHVMLLSKRFDLTEKVKETNVFVVIENEEK